jgi:putative heme degradation protein
MYADIHSAASATIPRSPASPADRSASGIWPELLSDLGCLGDLWVETESPALTLAHHADLTGLRAQRDTAHVRGEDFALRLLLEHCDALSPMLPPCGAVASPVESLFIEDAQRRPLLTLHLAPQDDPSRFLLRTLLRTYGIGARRLRPAPYRPASLRGPQAAAEHAAAALEQRCAGLDDGIKLMDQAELSGLLALQPRRLRDHGSAIGVDPDLVPCALEALTDHAVPIRIVTGNDACVRRVDGAPFAARRGRGWQYLRGDDLTLRLDTTLLDSAWVFQPSDDPAAGRELRLYDVDDRAIMVLRSLPSRSGAEHPVWTTLINALLH